LWFSPLSQEDRLSETAMEIALMETSEEGSSTISNGDKKDNFFISITQTQVSKSHRSLRSKIHDLPTWLKAN